ncbi:hypothetical protein TEA_010230 [Camellia sinensis var. sinensis]|uniref:T-complex protein 11 n=1 Tax=Camellia sinensis var. sinensis TaxID=542762 RepID=A0A4S4EIW1_CAMSN|nr:hypothetical protein TEA_010230 [Camellia sinensis var. sinensis]
MMTVGVDSSEAGRVAGVAMEFPATDDTASPPRIPPRLQRRLSESKTSSPSTVEEIEAKLRDADLRRQKFYEDLSNKARPKPRHSSSHEDDLAQRLEAKLQAAEQKRLSILAKSQMRLSKLDELRQAAKTGLEMRFKKECAELAAEKKRLGLLEKKRARARMLQARKVAKAVSHQREIERRKMKDKLEDRLQRAKRKRAEYLSQRGRLHNSDRVNWNKMHKEAELLPQKLARCWRQFLKLNKTTLDLAKAYNALNINDKCVKSMPFEKLALLIESPATLQTVKALLDRLENRYKLSKPVFVTSNPSSWGDIDHLLNRVASPNKKGTPTKSTHGKDVKRRGSIGEASKRSPVKLSRYQVRIVLCAYMILGHPVAVFSDQGEREIDLAKSAEKFVQEFELLMKIILDGPIQSSNEESDHALARRWTFRPQLAAFDAAWCSYLNSFVMWKVNDAESLEEDLVRAACQLELSMIQTCKMTPDGDSGAVTHDMKAIQKQVTEDQKLLRERVHHLSGDAGIERMELALSDTRMNYFHAKESGSPVGSPIMDVLSPSPFSSPAHPSVANSDQRGNMIEGNQRASPVVRSLFRDASLPPKEVGSSASSSNSGSQFQNSGEKSAMENELIVNEVLHEQHQTFAGSLNVTAEDQSSMKAYKFSVETGVVKPTKAFSLSKVKETMEKAFWDGITDTMKQDEPRYDQVVELMREVRDEICDMAPQSWKGEIFEAIDLDVLSQVLNSGKLDMDYLGNILEFALNTLQKLSASANEGELKVVHQKLLKELVEICQAGDGSNHSYVIALIKGLRFVLEQTQALKQEISKARIKIMEPLLRGPAGLDYLKNAFANRYGPPSDASTALPLTMRWLSSVWDSIDREWLEHTNALSELTRSQESSSQRLLPSTTLRTGGSIFRMSGASNIASNATGSDNKHPECKGEKVDLLVRLGLLKLANEVSSLTQEALPETLKLNLARLMAVQAQLQKIIVISTSILVLRQSLLSEQMVCNSADMEIIVSSCVKQLSDHLDSVEDAGIKEIIEILGTFAEGDDSGDSTKLQSRKNVMARLLTKSLQADDPIFIRVSRAVYLAARGIMLGGSGTHGRELAEIALRQVGAAVLLDRVVEAARVLLVASTVSCGVHGPWHMCLSIYEKLLLVVVLYCYCIGVDYWVVSRVVSSQLPHMLQALPSAVEANNIQDKDQSNSKVIEDLYDIKTSYRNRSHRSTSRET